MGSMDRNTVIGFVLLAGLLFVYLFISTKNSKELEYQKLKQQDSIAAIQKVRDSIVLASDTSRAKNVDTSAIGQPVLTEELTVVSNDVMEITFSNKGGQPRAVKLKNYVSYRDSTPVVLNGTSYDKISYGINRGGRGEQV